MARPEGIRFSVLPAFCSLFFVLCSLFVQRAPVLPAFCSSFFVQPWRLYMLISQRTLRFGPHTLLAADAGQDVVPYFLAGRKMYYVGMTSGDMQPIGAEHLVGEMGGLWAHFDEGRRRRDDSDQRDQDGVHPMAHSVELIELLSHLEWRYRIGGMEVKRRDFIVEDQAAFVSLVTLRNAGVRPRSGHLHLNVWLKFLGGWFSGQSTGGGEYWLEDRVVLGYDKLWQAAGAWHAAPPWRPSAVSSSRARSASWPRWSTLHARAGRRRDLEFVLAADHERGHEGARRLFGQIAGNGEKLLTAKVEHYHRKIIGGVALETPDKAVNRSFALAKANLQLLAADYARTCLTTSWPACRSTRSCLAATPSTPCLARPPPGSPRSRAARCWGWPPMAAAPAGASRTRSPPTGASSTSAIPRRPAVRGGLLGLLSLDGRFRAFLRQVYTLCQEGIDEYMPAVWGGGGSPLPDRRRRGRAHRHGLAQARQHVLPVPGAAPCAIWPRRSICTTTPGAMGRAPMSWRGVSSTTGGWRRRASTPTRATPTGIFSSMATGLLCCRSSSASPARSAQSVRLSESRTIGSTSEAWCIRAGARSRSGRSQPACWRSRLSAMASRAWGCICSKISPRPRAHGTLGAFKELIPIGLCFVQLWSAGLYLQGMIEGLLGLRPLAHRHQLSISPGLPVGWPWVRLGGLVVGEHTVALQITPSSLDAA